MKKKSLAVFIFCGLFIFSIQKTESFSPGTTPSFKENQKTYTRVRTAYNEKENKLKNLLREKSIDLNELKIFIRIFKKEAQLEVWVAQKTSSTFSLFQTYSICSSSGDPGPKRKAGDGQVPEGFYRVETFNPVSNFYLSLKLNYPNQSDIIVGGKKNPGGDIFIHGNCVTIGCIPITDEKIKEVYLLAVEARNAGQSVIPVHVFPCKMNGEEMNRFEKEFQGNKNLLAFWKNLEEGFDFFEAKKKIPVTRVNKDGSYSFSEN